MAVLNIAMAGSDELAREIAKPVDERDVQSYVHKEVIDDVQCILSLIRPIRYPEKLRPLLSALSAGRVGIIEVKAIDATFGETLVAFSAAGITKGIIVINPDSGGWVDEDQVKKSLVQVGLDKWIFCTGDGLIIRQTLLVMMSELEENLAKDTSRPLVIPVDQYFNVKGIGLVAIGYVQSGVVKVHDTLAMIPTGGSGEVKSLQVMDDDVQEARAGDRVGIALRNCSESHLAGGAVIVHPEIEDRKSGKSAPLAVELHRISKVDLQISPFQRRRLEVGDVIHASIDLQFVVGRIETIDDGLIVKWETPLLIRRDTSPPVVITQLDSNLRIMGPATLYRCE